MPSLDDIGLLLTIAGHDPTGGAGLTTDMAVWQAMGRKGASVCTALTVQNAHGVQQVAPSDPAVVRAALAALCAEVEPVAVKVGMLGDVAVAAEVAGFCGKFEGGPVVWDPVLGASAGGAPLTAADANALRSMARTATVITPNREEAAALLGLPAWGDLGPIPAAWLQAMREQWLREGRTQAVVLKGGHALGALSVDWLVTRDNAQPLVVPRLGRGSHGTGCLHAATMAAMLAAGWSVVDAAVEAQWRTHAGIAQAWTRAGGRPMVNASASLDSSSFPARPFGGVAGGVPADGAGATLAASHVAPGPAAESFAPLAAAVGFYPIVPDVDWALRLLDWGVRTLQLRIKDLHGAALEAAIARVNSAAQQAGAQLFVNDHWRQALAVGAYGVHLGQEDLVGADLAGLRAAGLRLGVSTHTPAELARAHALQPSYVALGPVFPTTLKVMPYRPLGLERLRDWAARCKPRYPVVAIGGIGLDQAAAVMACGADGFAVVSAVTQTTDPQAAVRRGLAIAKQALDCRNAARA
ncbi:thiamine phosphate synthase [Thiomonas sp. FB-Cd]|uniref:thiamine phosphate synthase n=1 Tax=Thiomonas sp. FB-Cd TaxID=1158292 RepID=UPI00068D660F|nr:thiamine phosphate synthase [Thiomonas sp. FB-Cd]